jgi:hypothetical protein
MLAALHHSCKQLLQLLSNGNMLFRSVRAPHAAHACQCAANHMSTLPSVHTALYTVYMLQALREEDLAAIVDAGDPIRYSSGEVVRSFSYTAVYTMFQPCRRCGKKT